MLDASGKGFVLTATVLLATLVFASLSGVISDSSPGWLRDHLHGYALLWPQRWSFFTGLARDDVIIGYKIYDDPVYSTRVDFVKQSRRAFTDRLGGLDRSGDTQQYELTQLMNQIPGRFWQDCGALTLAVCRPAVNISRYVHLVNHSKNRTWCGRFAVSLARPTHVELTALSGTPRTIDKVALVELQCTG